MAEMASADLSLSTSSQEEESAEYVGYDRTLRPPSNSSGSTTAANLINNNNNKNNNNNNNNNNNIISSINSSNNNATNSGSTSNANVKKYDVMKSDYDAALMDFTQLRHQHDLGETVTFFQQLYVTAINQLQNSDRSNADIVAENARLKQQNNMLEHKVLRLENDNGNAAGSNTNAYYCDYNEVPSNRSSSGGSGSGSKCDGTCPESEKLLDELHLCKERNTDLLKERNVIVTEREKYKKNFSSAMTELENVKKGRNFYRDAREQFNIQRDLMEKDIQKLKSMLAMETNKVLTITVQRSRIEEELNQLLSEKDNVLQEHQKMSDDLVAANKDLDKFKKEELLYKNEIKSLQQTIAELKKRDLLKSRESSWSKEFSDSKDDFKELEKLRKQLEKAHSEVERAQQDTEEAKRVRDWAISQREKIVQERDSVKTLCDNLRKERDKAISDLLSAIRDSEKIKKQKDEAQKKIDALKEQIESQNLDNASRRSFRLSTYEAEDMLDIELLNYHSHSDIGIILDDTNNRQLVCGVTSASPAIGKLKINDVICKVNNVDCANMSKRMVFDEIRASAPRCNLLVARTRHSKRHFYTVHLNLQDNPNHGLHLDMGVFISKIESNSLAASEPELDVGDRVLSINNKSMDGMQCLDEIMSLLNDEQHESLSIFALKNVQDIAWGEAQRRMTTSSAQTDSIDSMHRVTSTKHPSKIAEMLSKFKKQMHISKPGTADVDHFAQENDAIAALDSVLSENSSAEKNKKKEKRSKKEKEAAAKSMGTWPRTNILNATHENLTGTIVQRHEKKRAPLSLFTPGPINVDKDDERDTCDEPPPLPPQSKPPLSNVRLGGSGSAIKTNPNRNSNPIPIMFQDNAHSVGNQGQVPGGVGGGVGVGSNSAGGVGTNYIRHSVFGTAITAGTPMETEPLVMEHTKPLQRPAPIMGANMRVKLPSTDKYAQQRSHNFQNRYSLNITPMEHYKTSGQQAQQQVINHCAATNDFHARRHFLDMFNSSVGNKNAHHPALFAPLSAHNQNHNNNNSNNNNNNNNNNNHTSSGSSNNMNNFIRSNLGQTQPQQQQNSLDMISLKSQNSIDSILSTKSPPISEYAISNYVKRGGMPMGQAARNVSKYPSDSESIASGIVSSSGGPHGGLFHNSNNVAQHRHTQLFPSFTQSSSHHPIRQIRHSSPLTLPSPPPLHAHAPPTTSGVHHASHLDNSGGVGIPTSSVDKFDMDYVNHHAQASYVHDYPPPLPPSTSQSHHPTQPHYHPQMGVAPLLASGAVYEGGTFPRKKDHQRLRIPSNPSVASKSSGVKNSSGSIDHHYGGVGAMMSNSTSSTIPPISGMPMQVQHTAVTNAAANGGGGSGRGSPMPQVHVEVLSHGGSKRNSNVPADFLCPGDLRRVTIEKSDKSLGITIQCNNNGGGIFVSTVADKSIATRAGLQVGDQLLEVCGLNMRSATNDIAANVLRQCGNSITMLVQFNPEKFHSAEYEGTNNLDTESPVNHSGSPTPRNSPRPPARGVMALMPSLNMGTSSSMPGAPNVGIITGNNGANSPPPHLQSSMLPTSSSLMSAQSSKDQSFADSLENQSDISSSQDIPSSAATTTTASTTSTVYEEEPRYVTLHMDKSKNLGIKLFGGNKVGIFVHDVHPGSTSDHAGIRKGDQILEYNGVDLRCVTAEQAANEISKLTDTVTMLVQNKLKKLKQIKDKSGDSFYIRVGFDRTGDLNEGDLRFVKDEVLYVDNTVFNGTFGMWRAWKLDAKGHRKECGIIPSQMKVEEELRSGEVVDCEGGTARRGSTSARRSFFRRKKHQRSSSRDSTEIASFSNTQLSFFPDSGILNDDGGILSYQRVERLDSPVRRPVLIIGPLSECVMDRLTIDFSNLFKLCEVTIMDCSQDAMEEGLQENIFVDYRRRGNKFECTTVEAINNACKNDRRHCILDISISAVERLQRLQIYPIVLLLRFKSAKQIREIRDYGIDKISAKAAKEMYERALKLETDYKQYISAVIPGVSIKHMCTQIKDAVDKEQDKLLWVPYSSA